MTELPSGVIGTWGDVFDEAAPEVQANAQALRDLIRVLHPQTCEVARPGDRAVTFGHGPRKMKDGYLYLMPQRAWLNLGFYHGASLPDPDGLLEGTGRALRHVKLRAVMPDGVRALIVASIG